MKKSSLGFLASIAGAITSFCSAFIRSMTVVEDAVGMAEASVKVARKKQAVDLKIEMTDYATRRINEGTLKIAKQEEAMAEYVSSNETRKELVNKTKAHLTEQVNRALAELDQIAE